MSVLPAPEPHRHIGHIGKHIGCCLKAGRYADYSKKKKLKLYKQLTLQRQNPHLKRYLTAIILFIAIAGSSFNKIIVLLDFKLNENFIAASLCENRSMPASCCHGKCYLKKKLQKEEDGSKTGSGETRSKFEVNLFCEPCGELFLSQSIKSVFTASPATEIPAILLSSVFHPPGRI